MPLARSPDLSLRLARAVLGVTAHADHAQVRRAFREQAKRLHPDRSGGDAAKFRAILEAYRLIQGAEQAAAEEAAAAPQPPRYNNPPPARRPPPLYRPAATISPTRAMLGGVCETDLADGRRIRIQLPPGLREGDLVRAGGEVFTVTIRPEGETMVRGGDFWMTAKVAPAVLKTGGRVAVTTPLGRRIVWITKAAGERGLVRLEGQGLPARGAYAQGHLFLRLAAEEVPQESRARTLLRRFAEAWAA